jgi:hypothetical protein
LVSTIVKKAKAVANKVKPKGEMVRFYVPINTVPTQSQKEDKHALVYGPG